MTVSMIGGRTVGTTDDGLVPVPGDRVNTIRFEPADGTAMMFAVATGFRVRIAEGTKLVSVVSASELKVTIFITDSRVAFACTNYDKGGGWIGNSALVPLLNGVSKAWSAYRSRGVTLTGQVRYAWLADVGSHDKEGFFNTEQLRIICKERIDSQLVPVYLDFTLPGDVSSAAVAAEVARRAARFRLAAGDGQADPADAAQLARLAETRPIPSAKGSYALHSFPSSWPVSPVSVDLAGLIARRQATQVAPATDAPVLEPESGTYGSEPKMEPEPDSHLDVDDVARSACVVELPQAAYAEPLEGGDSWVATTDDGAVIPLTALTLIGRRPEAQPDEVDRVADADITFVHLVDPSMQMSKTHLGIELRDDEPWAVDRHSTNGTSAITSDGETALVPGVASPLPEGTRLEVGGRWLTIRRAAPPRAPTLLAAESRAEPPQAHPSPAGPAATSLPQVSPPATSGDSFAMFQAGSAPPRDGRPEWMPHWVPEPVASLPPPILVLAGGVLVVVLIIFWVSGHQPTSQAEVCAAYTRVYDEMNDPANDIYANALFDAVGDLASVASRYNGGDVDLRADAAALKSIAESTSTFDSSIISASSTIAVLCGRD